MTPHPLVRQLLVDYLAIVDAELPGRVEGLYLVGSVALDDFRPGVSDVDFVAVTAEPLLPDAARAVGRTHARMARRHRRPHFDGIYVTWQDLAADPSTTVDALDAHEGRVRRRGPDGGDPVAWHTLAEHGVPVRGPRREDVEVWTDRRALAAWTHRNLDEYWRRWLHATSRTVSAQGFAGLTAQGPAWGVLGVSRLHYTLATGEITSKSGAGRYARETFDPRWRRIVDECLRIRGGGSGPGYRSPFARRRDALDFVAMAIDDAHRIG
ncbi:aminoglycoside adenylyltransferase domain-containing protein [Plantactinospora endophytica]|uniref:aminoglycoside adenylyltransferase domain-containing protein n=1 Tax=Plantactinospora endophytica TaxID=673535 RepID=UPI0019425BAE|nr:aminoglycoside adenylyltransferase domain-containing protein [Plantactinospora endophytica]